MAKSILAAFLLLAIALQTFNRGLIVSGYYLKAYVKNCENKAKPQMACNGRCQMMKKMKAEEKNDRLIPSSRLEQVLSSKSFFAHLAAPKSSSLQHHTIYEHVQLPEFAPQHFHPPGQSLLG